MCFRPPTIEMENPKCSKCGAELMLGARKCVQCGEAVDNTIGAASTPEAHGAPGAPDVPPSLRPPSSPGAPKAPAPPKPPAPKPFSPGS